MIKLLMRRGRRWKQVISASLWICLSLSMAVAQAADLIGIPEIIDVDTLRLGATRVRLHGIDAPEGRQLCLTTDRKSYRCGDFATDALKQIVGAKSIRCTQIDTDRFHRVVAKCFIGRMDVSEEMVRRGWAVAFRRYSWDYAAAEKAAQKAGRGLWSGQFVTPEEWRKSAR